MMPVVSFSLSQWRKCQVQALVFGCIFQHESPNPVHETPSIKGQIKLKGYGQEGLRMKLKLKASEEDRDGEPNEEEANKEVIELSGTNEVSEQQLMQFLIRLERQEIDMQLNPGKYIVEKSIFSHLDIFSEKPDLNQIVEKLEYVKQTYQTRSKEPKIQRFLKEIKEKENPSEIQNSCNMNPPPEEITEEGRQLQEAMSFMQRPDGMMEFLDGASILIFDVVEDFVKNCELKYAPTLLDYQLEELEKNFDTYFTRELNLNQSDILKKRFSDPRLVANNIQSGQYEKN